ncbi:MAG: preprotein translocase subunit YajC [Rickettsiaceae bacterium]|nr:preprotein translocase subunit YajC [Rickettsiaceae bacterium]
MNNDVNNEEFNESENESDSMISETILVEDEPYEAEADNSFLLDTLKGALPLLLIFFVFYFLLLRPQEKRRKVLEDMIKSLKKGEKVITTGGIIGVVTKINESQNTVNLKISNNVEDVEFSRSAIIEIISRNK